MLIYIVRRLIVMIPVTILISVIGFIIIQAPPGDFVSSYIAGLEAQGEIIEPELIDSLRARYGLGEPIYVQYWKWVSSFVEGDLGYSMIYREPVVDIIAQRLPSSFTISLLSLFLVFAIGIPIGVLSATKQYSLADYSFTVVGFLGVATPNFLLALVGLWLLFKWTGTVAIGLYSPEMQNAPFGLAKFLDLLGHIWLPALIVGTAGTAELIRTMRANLLDELPKQYVTVARARGVKPTKLLYKYPLRIAINPVISTVGWLLPVLVEGEVLVSLVLGLPTIAPVLLDSLMQQDMFFGDQHHYDTGHAYAHWHASIRYSACHRGSANKGGSIVSQSADPAMGMHTAGSGGPSDSLLTVRNLQTHFFSREGVVKAVDGVSFDIRPGEILGIAGESGCGKSVTSQSILRILPKNGKIVEGEIFFKYGDRTVDLIQEDADGAVLRDIRGKEIAMIFQEPMTAFSPVHTVGDQIIETIRIHQQVSKEEAHEQALEMLRRVGMPNPARNIDQYTFNLSGGMRQRAMVALSLSCRPKLLIADEPTTAVDVTIQAQMLELLRDIQADLGMAIIMITHDLGVIAELTDRVMIMYLGQGSRAWNCGGRLPPTTAPLHAWTALVHPEDGAWPC